MISIALDHTSQKEESPLNSADNVKTQQVSLIRKELVALTGNHSHAVILNQLLYWTQRIKDFDLLLEEEKNCYSNSQGKHHLQPQHGWIYKTSNDLIKETMLQVNRSTIRRYTNVLIQKGWVYERPNPSNKWDKTIQYRVNLNKIQEDLLALGQSLPDIYLKGLNCKKDPLEMEESSEAHFTLSNLQNAFSNTQNNPSRMHDAPSNVQNCSLIYLNRDYTETTNKEHTQRISARDISKNFFEKVLQTWEQHIGQEVHLTRGRQRQLKSVLSLYFGNDPQQWESFCVRVKASPFLMGEGPRKWRVTLDWILEEANLLKILEGNFDNPETLIQKKEETSEIDRKKEISSILDSIKDPIWREWCSQLNFDFQSQDSVSLSDLKEIADARFLEVEDDRLVWIGGSNKQVLDRIESLRLKIFPIIEKTFPNTRTLRTRLCEEDPQQNHGEAAAHHSSHTSHNTNTNAIGETHE